MLDEEAFGAFELHCLCDGAFLSGLPEFGGSHRFAVKGTQGAVDFLACLVCQFYVAGHVIEKHPGEGVGGYAEEETEVARVTVEGEICVSVWKDICTEPGKCERFVTLWAVEVFDYGEKRPGGLVVGRYRVGCHDKVITSIECREQKSRMSLSAV